MEEKIQLLENPYAKNRQIPKQMSNDRRPPLKPWQGIVFFLAETLLFLVLGVPVQYAFGIYGVAITELAMLVLSVGFIWLGKWSFREVFPIQRPNLSGVCGVCVFWLGANALTNLVTMLLAYFFPEQLASTSSGLNNVMVSVPLIVSVFIVSVMPAICEEAMHRGVILSSFRSLKREWLIVLLMGIIFGIFHMDPIRFLPTALLGGMLSYLMLKTDNLVYPALFHFINNICPLLLSFFLASQTPDAFSQQMDKIPLYTLGISFVQNAAAPFLLYTGAWLFKRGSSAQKLPYLGEKKKYQRLLLLLTLTGIMLFVGVVLFILGLYFDFKNFL